MKREYVIYSTTKKSHLHKMALEFMLKKDFIKFTYLKSHKKTSQIRIINGDYKIFQNNYFKLNQL